MYTTLLPPGGYPIAVNKYIIYQISTQKSLLFLTPSSLDNIVFCCLSYHVTPFRLNVWQFFLTKCMYSHRHWNFFSSSFPAVVQLYRVRINYRRILQKPYFHKYWTEIHDFFLNINQLDALNFIMSLFYASTCFEHACSSSGGQNCTIQPLVSSHL